MIFRLRKKHKKLSNFSCHDICKGKSGWEGVMGGNSCFAYTKAASLAPSQPDRSSTGISKSVKGNSSQNPSIKSGLSRLSSHQMLPLSVLPHMVLTRSWLLKQILLGVMPLTLVRQQDSLGTWWIAHTSKPKKIVIMM